MNTNLSESIKLLRKQKNLTQEDIASALGMTYQAVSRWETGASYPDVELLPALASVLDVSLDALFRIDEKSEERKIEQYLTECDKVINIPEEEIKLTKKYVAELPSNAFLKYRLLSAYKNAGTEYAKGKLGEMRKLCQYVVDHCTDSEWFRDQALNDMISVEDDDNLDIWLSLLDNRTVISSSNALTNRYFYRNEVDKYNVAIQQDIISSLKKIFLDDFCKRDAATYKNAESRSEGQRKILQIIDVLRNPEIECDAWIDTRAFAYMRLAGGEFGAGNNENGYIALEKSLELYVTIAELADDAELKYNCPSLDLLTGKFSKARKTNRINRAYQCLTASNGWEWFNGVRNEERFIRQIDRIKPFCEKYGIE